MYLEAIIRRVSLLFWRNPTFFSSHFIMNISHEANRGRRKYQLKTGHSTYLSKSKTKHQSWIDTSNVDIVMRNGKTEKKMYSLQWKITVLIFSIDDICILISYSSLHDLPAETLDSNNSDPVISRISTSML